jgi:hypothetical protein
VEIPFDVASFRAITFSRIDYEDFEAAQKSLKSTVEEVIKPSFEVENPITHARGVVKLKEHASDALRVVLDEMDSLKKKMSQTEIAAYMALQAAYMALQNANAALGTVNSSPLEKLMGFNPASSPPMIFTSSGVPDDPRMGAIFGLTPTSSNRTLVAPGALGDLLGTAPKKEKDEMTVQPLRLRRFPLRKLWPNGDTAGGGRSNTLVWTATSPARPSV